MPDGGEGFDGRIEVIRRTRGYRRWPDEVKARIVAESFRPGVRVAEVARRHGVLAHQLSAWRRQARKGLLALPEDAVEGLEAAFVPLTVEPECGAGLDGLSGVVTIEIGAVILRVPGNVPAERAAALVRALQEAP
ncbi:transposase [Cereibacter azotoformans]|uniref:Transposase n=2 Tax=Cereibacter TaxID=1653176 RepID=A0A2T5JWU0_9RHOB|nr:transposase [Cereibacter azotoformans]AXQ93046.1 transposase [Cereibacter sphaeroides]AXQ95496.1 transposase [Cereibacter sphaeroides]AXQ96234.1 transposase [Cereibacter sphaeroides]MBO4169261.1 transposase [Cereibacter azotoformans]PTR14639.1 transposase [Cereibacter azotoformans]